MYRAAAIRPNFETTPTQGRTKHNLYGMMQNIVRMMEMMIVVRENAFYLPKLKNFCCKVTFSFGKNKKGIVSNNNNNTTFV